MDGDAFRVGYLIQHFPPEPSSGASRAEDFLPRWRDQGADVVAITGMPNRPRGRIYPEFRGRLFREDRWEGIRVLRSWLYATPTHGPVRTLANNATFLATSVAHALRRAPRLDVLVASSPPFFVHAAGAAIARALRVPLVLEARDLWPDYLAAMGALPAGWTARPLFAVERRLFRGATRVVAVTESSRRRIVAKGIAAEKVHVVPNGVDLDRYAPRDGHGDPLERRPGEFLVGYLGNFGLAQGLDALIHAAARLRDRAPGIRFVLVGGGTAGEELRALRRELGADNVRFLDAVPRERTPDLYRAMDACVVPLAPLAVFQETIPSKIFEILACARPVLACARGEAARAVEESGAGVVAPPGDPEAIAESALALSALPREERERMGRRGRAWVAEHHDVDRLSRRYLEILRSASSAGRGPRPGALAEGPAERG